MHAHHTTPQTAQDDSLLHDGHHGCGCVDYHFRSVEKEHVPDLSCCLARQGSGKDGEKPLHCEDICQGRLVGMDAVYVRRVFRGIGLLYHSRGCLLKVINVTRELGQKVLKKFPECSHVSGKGIEILSKVVFGQDVINEEDHDL